MKELSFFKMCRNIYLNVFFITPIQARLNKKNIPKILEELKKNCPDPNLIKLFEIKTKNDLRNSWFLFLPLFFYGFGIVFNWWNLTLIGLIVQIPYFVMAGIDSYKIVKYHLKEMQDQEQKTKQFMNKINAELPIIDDQLNSYSKLIKEIYDEVELGKLDRLENILSLQAKYELLVSARSKIDCENVQIQAEMIDSFLTNTRQLYLK